MIWLLLTTFFKYTSWSYDSSKHKAHDNQDRVTYLSSVFNCHTSIYFFISHIYCSTTDYLLVNGLSPNIFFLMLFEQEWLLCSSYSYTFIFIKCQIRSCQIHRWRIFSQNSIKLKSSQIFQMFQNLRIQAWPKSRKKCPPHDSTLSLFQYYLILLLVSESYNPRQNILESVKRQENFGICFGVVFDRCCLYILRGSRGIDYFCTQFLVFLNIL